MSPPCQLARTCREGRAAAVANRLRQSVRLTRRRRLSSTANRSTAVCLPGSGGRDRIGVGVDGWFCGGEEVAVPLTIAAHTVYQGITHLTLAGEADLATVEPLREAITRAVQAVHGEHVAGVLIDLHAVRFLDSTTIGVLVEGRRLADEKGIGY